MESQILNQARTTLKHNLPELLQRSNVQACGLGYKVSAGKRTDKLSLVVSVTHKVPAEELSPADLIPSEISGLVTDVVATGKFHAFAPLDPTGTSQTGTARNLSGALQYHCGDHRFNCIPRWQAIYFKQ